MAIHPTAIISKEAEIDLSTEIGPFVIIEGGVKIGKNNHIMSNVFIGTGTTIGDKNRIHMGAVVGHVPQDLSFKGEESFLDIGDNNTIREHATIHRSSSKGKRTIVGNNCLIMGGVHIAHDCILGNSLIIANMAGIAGHVVIDDGAFISGGVMVHQFVKVGRKALVAGNSRLSMDVPPFVIAAERNELWGINVIGLRRAGFPKATIHELRELYRIFVKSNIPRSQLLDNIRAHSFSASEVQEFIKFVETSTRGICRPHSPKAVE